MKKSNKKYKNKYDRMANAPVKGLISSLAVPTIITMLVSAIYNMADSYFVGKIDTTSVASIGIVFSIMTLLQAIGFFLGNGSGVMISTLLGEKKKNLAQIYANVAFFTAFIIGIVMALAGLFFSANLAKLLGATESTIESASGYLKYILFGSPFILGSFVINNQLRYQGSAIYSMAGILSGSILNIIIDPLFIFTFKLGVQGAAIATIVSQFVGFIVLIIGTLKGGNIRLTLKKFKPNRKILLSIFKNGLPSLARQGVQTVATICLNFACAPYGDAVVAGMSVFNRVMFLGFAVVIGFGQGYQPVCSFNNGAKNYKRVYDGYKFTARITTIIITVFAVIAFIFAPQLISIFRNDAEVIEIGTKALRYQCIAMPLLGYCTASNMLMQSLKISGKATILALARQGIFYVPLILLLPRFIDTMGIILTQPIADLLSFVMTLFLVTPTSKRLKSKSTK
ncbi:MAG: MATE family efflux transporter [Eubacterium sp.]|nr:MATE family efflux transporter [Eubacterium sp.]